MLLTLAEYLEGFVVEYCANCGITLTDNPKVLSGADKIRLRYESKAGDVFCEACYFQAPDFGQYEETGKMILK